MHTSIPFCNLSNRALSLQDKRLALIDKFFTHHDQSTLESILADDAQIVEQGTNLRTYNKSEWVNLFANHVVPAVPDYKWHHSTDGSKDVDGYSIVTVQVSKAAVCRYSLLGRTCVVRIIM